ncbi:thiopeptide-type bacteriocin biosynthesis protein [Streptomonospora algeriensis]|uniref:Thiopeptide-type bacteriocin biosynthesis protein n=1 Tax=Streptomonospora algeriensis TaxID=995084 RepID=A0ABW3B9D7_9ACTN
MPPEHAHAPPWQQLSVTFTDPGAAEGHLLTHLGPTLLAAETDDLITAWFFIRKNPWRVRYLPTDIPSAAQATATLHRATHQLRDSGIARCSDTIYEPETHAFGGPAGMRAAHHLFHADSRNFLAHLAADHTASGGARGENANRRELSLLLCAALMRAAGLDRYEQGDVWAQLAAHRPRNMSATPQRRHGLVAAVQRLTTVDTAPGTALRDEALAFAHDWLAAFETAGRTLRSLAETGSLTRGIRAVITHHIIFHWNRLGLAYRTQSALAHAAKEAAFADPRDFPHAELVHTTETRGALA